MLTHMRSTGTVATVLAISLAGVLLLRVGRSLAQSARRASCRVNASYNSRYRNYDVYVHSNQPHHYVWVADSNGDHADYYTDGNGYADVYLYVSGNPHGQTVTAHVGRASCSTTLS